MSIRVGVIGVGGIGGDHLRRLGTVLSGVVVAAVSDPDAQRATTALNGGDDAVVLADGFELIRRSDVDAVVIASPGFTHADYVVACLAVGKPVFCEKPLAISADDAWRVVQAEVAEGRRLVQLGFMRRYDESYRALKASLDTRVIGEPLIIHCAHRNPEVPPTWTAEMTIADSSVHDVDIVRFLTGDEIVASTVVRPRSSHHVAGLQDPLIILLETAKGVIADVELSVNIGYGYDIRAEVIGESGTAALGDDGLVTLKSAGRRSTDVPADWRQRFNRAYDRELQEWIHATQRGDCVGPSSWDGFVATTVAEASMRSYVDGGRVAVSLPVTPKLYE